MRDCGELRFRFAGHGLSIYPPGATFGPRTLRDFEFVWIVDGDVRCRFDDTEVAAPAGTVLLGRPGMRDHYFWDPQRHTRHGFVHFSIDHHGAQLPPIQDWPLARQLNAGDIIRPLLRHLIWLLSRRGPDWEELAQGALRQVLMAYLSGEGSVAGEGGVAGSPIVERVLLHVQARWSHGPLVEITLTDLAAAAGVTPGHLTRVFRAALAVTPMEAMRLLRLERAATMLARSNLPVQEVARQCGFPSPFHFSRLFKATYRHAPRAFRSRIAAGMDMPTTRLHVSELLARVW
jgi:AraC family transcriptional regulator